MKNTLKIGQQIWIGLITTLLLALLTIYIVIEAKVKPDLVTERQQQIAVNQAALDHLLSAKLEKIQLLTSTLALAGAELPKDESLFKKVFPSIIDNHDDKSIAGGGIWPEPSAFTQGVERRSFFWGRSGASMTYLDDYNDTSGTGYHNETWYTVGRTSTNTRCAWSEAYIDPVTSIPMVTCTVPIEENNAFTGVATVDMMLDGIADILDQYGEENQGYVFAIDHTGQILSMSKGDIDLVQPDGSMLTATELSRTLDWLRPALTTTGGDRQVFSLDHDEILGGTAYVDTFKHSDTGWTIGLVVPKSSMTSLANSMGLFLMVSVGVLLLIVSSVVMLFFRRLLRKIRQTTKQIRNLADGESSQELEIGAANELGGLRMAVNAYGKKLKTLLENIQIESANIVGGAERLGEFGQNFLTKANSLIDENHILAAATEELGKTSQDVAMYANKTKETVDHIHKDVQTSGDEMQKVIQTMLSLSTAMTQAQGNIIKLDEDSRKANNMLSVIRDIAEQTNLLALNAAIEAARAGETGRGFAVVADEVRNLAKKSESSAVEIEEVLGQLQVTSKESVTSMELGQSETEKAVTTVELTATHLQEVVSAFSTITEQATQISVAAGEQQKVSNDLSKFVSRLQELTSSNAADSTQLSQMNQEIDAIAQRLTTLK